MLDKIKELMEMRKQAEQMKRELQAVTTEVKEVPGITIVINGTQDFKSVTLDEDFLKGSDKAKIERELLRGINAAIAASQRLVAEKMKTATGLDIH